MFKRVPRAFTLIEVLVVVAIIALLVAILVPSLMAARDQAQAVVCKTRMRELYNGHVLYGADNKQRFPHWDCWLWDGIEHEYLSGPNIYAKWGGTPPTNPQARVTLGQIYRYLKNKEVYFCPKDSKRRGVWAIGGQAGTTAIHSFSRCFEANYFALWQKNGGPYPPNSNWPAYDDKVDSTDVMTPDMISIGTMGQAAAQHVGVPCNTTPNHVGLMFEEWQTADDQLVVPWDSGLGDLNDGYSAPMLASCDHITTRHRNRGDISYWDGHVDLVDGVKLNTYPPHYGTGIVPVEQRYAATVLVGARKN